MKVKPLKINKKRRTKIMKELRIELPSYEGRQSDINTIAMLAAKNDLNFEGSKIPYLTVTDTETKETLLTADGTYRCYVFLADEDNDDSKLKKFLKEMGDWFTKF